MRMVEEPGVKTVVREIKQRTRRKSFSEEKLRLASHGGPSGRALKAKNLQRGPSSGSLEAGVTITDDN